jgi:hypothetical protein
MRRSSGKAMIVATANPDATTASLELKRGRVTAVSPLASSPLVES